MDCTILCEDGHSLEAHNVIFAACTPFFRIIPRRNSHQHPLIYLKGTIKKEMGLVLNFMYQGEVEMPEEDLNSFLVTAYQLIERERSATGQLWDHILLCNRKESSASSKGSPAGPPSAELPPRLLWYLLGLHRKSASPKGKEPVAFSAGPPLYRATTKTMTTSRRCSQVAP